MDLAGAFLEKYCPLVYCLKRGFTFLIIKVWNFYTSWPHVELFLQGLVLSPKELDLIGQLSLLLVALDEDVGGCWTRANADKSVKSSNKWHNNHWQRGSAKHHFICVPGSFSTSANLFSSCSLRRSLVRMLSSRRCRKARISLRCSPSKSDRHARI